VTWRERLAAMQATPAQESPGGVLPKLTEAPFVGFVGTPGGHSANPEPAVRHETGRAHLLALAADELLPAGLVHRLSADDVAACAGESDETLRAYLRALERSAMLAAGQCPPEFTSPALCYGCGPVWLWPGSPSRVLACPWCRVRPKLRTLPRPPVACGECRHYVPDTVNPPAGCGACGLGLPYRRGERGRWPMATRHCPEFRPP